MRLFAAPTKAKDIVSIQGSVLGGWNFLDKTQDEVPVIAAKLLDAGTTRKSKKVLREGLAARGIHLSFSAGGDRTFFSGNCLPEDLPYLLQTVAECLREANFAQEEVTTAKTRTLGEFEELKTDTRAQAGAALSRLLYDPKHTNYAVPLATSLQRVRAVKRADLLSFKKLYGRAGLVLAMAGDIKAAAALTAAEKAFAKLPAGDGSVATKMRNTKAPTAKEEFIAIKDKANIDIYLGASVPFTYNDEAYLPFTVFTSMLGGRGLSSGHLMRTVRERDGLTYGIYAVPAGFGDGADGMFRIWGTFSPDTYARAVDVTRTEIARFRKNGITEDILQKKKEEIAGSYAIGLSTTGGLAGMLHTLGREGKPLSYADTVTDLIRAITISDLRAVEALIPFDQLSLAAAGTLPQA